MEKGKNLVLQYLHENGPTSVSELLGFFRKAWENGTITEDVKLLEVLGILDEECLVLKEGSMCSLVE